MALIKANWKSINNKKIIHFFIIMMLFLCGTNLSAQDYSDYLERAKQRLREGECAKALDNYNAWKKLTKKTDYSIERNIAECNRLKKTTPDKTQPPAEEPQPVQNHELKPPTEREQQPLPPHPKPERLTTTFGFKAGVNLSNILNSTKDIDFSPQLKTDFYAGFFINMRFGGKEGLWGLQPEVLYSRQGFTHNGNTIDFHYITVPIMAKLNFGYSDAGNFNVELGPYFSYLSKVFPSSMEIIIKEDDSYSTMADIRLSDLKNGTDLGVAAGIGYDFKFGLTIGARYNQGLSDMAKNLQWKNSIASISLGFKFKR